MNITINKSIIGLVLGLATVLTGSQTATAASDYKVIKKHALALGDWEHHRPWTLVRFHLPRNYDANHRVVLQMNINSTNNSQYNSIYLNPEYIPSESEGCDHFKEDRNENTRIDRLPYAEHDRWNVYHTVTEGAYLQPGDNYLLICARNQHGEGWHNLDNFYVKDITLQYREYTPAPEFCAAVFEPVCGVDGRTYSNACDAQRANTEILYEGECPAE